MTTSFSQGNLLFALMKDVSEAIRLDRSEKDEDAYRKYLECVLRVSTALLKDLHSNDGHVKMSTDKLKMVKLGQQCMERVTLIVNRRFDLPLVSTSQRKQSDRVLPTSLSILADTGSKPRERTPNQSQQTMQITSPDSYKSSPSSQSPGKSTITSMKMSAKQKRMSPIEVAALHNQQLLSAFKARQSQAATGRHKRTFSTNLSLTLQRKMAENMAIAKAQEEILAQKMKERQQRLEEQAAKRFLTPIGLSYEEQHQRQIYRKVLEFEQEELWMIDERKKLEESPTDITVISHLITVILNCDSHPLTEQIKLYQNKLLDKVSSLVDDKTERVNQITVPLHSNLKTVLKKYKQTCQSQASSIDTVTHSTDEILDESKEVANNEKVCVIDEDSSVCSEKDVATDDSTTVETSSNNIVNTTDMSDRVEDGKGDEMSQLERDMETVTIEIKSELESAILKGDRVQEKLKQENTAVKSPCKQVTVDYEKYNQENMDELFDDDDSEDEPHVKTEMGKDLNDIEKPDDEGLEEELKLCLSSVDKFANNAIVAKLKNEAYLRHLKGITEDILTSIEKVQVLFVIAFQELDSAEGRDQCNVLLEGSFFRPLWNSLLILFRLANEPQELAIASYMTDKQSCDPQEFGVHEKLCLLPVFGDEQFPYQTSIKELGGIIQCPTMFEKLDCLVRTSKMVFQNVEKYYKQKDAHIADIGADDLLPILCYIVAKSGLPQIVSECHAMDRFIHEGYMFGEEGYCLTSFQTAINYLVSQGMENV